MDIRLKNITDLQEKINKSIKEFKEYLIDKSVPLEERWLAFSQHGHILPETSSCDNYGPIDLDSIHNPPNRYQTYSYSEDVNLLEDILILCQDRQPIYCAFKYCVRDLAKIGIIYNDEISVDDWNKQVTKFLNEIKEEVLSYGYSAYVFDW